MVEYSNAGATIYIFKLLEKTFGLSILKIKEELNDERTFTDISDFITGSERVPKLVFFYQSRDQYDEHGEVIEGSDSVPPSLFLTTGELERQKAQGIFFLRAKGPGKPINDQKPDDDLTYAILPPRAMEGLQVMLNQLYLPLIENESKGWKPGVGVDDSTAEFFTSYHKFGETLSEAVSSLQGGFTLKRPDNLFDIENKAAAFNRAGNEPHVVKAFEDVCEEWCADTEKLLAENENVRTEGDDAGPETELEYWRTRMAKFNAITEQLRGRDCKVVLGVLGAAKSRVLKRWKLLDNSITDANNEAKDNVKYLSTLEKYIEPLRSGTPETILDALPGLLNNIKMMHTIARYYGTSDRMTTLFRKITNKMIWNCKQYVVGPDPTVKLWDQDIPKLIQRLHSCLALNELYQENYYTTRDKLLTQPKGKQFDFNETAIFGKFDLFCRRVEKLQDMFTTVEQFANLSGHRVEGMETLMKTFQSIVDDFRRKPYELLDYQKGQFDRDFLEFNANIHELESSLQGFINSSFENITSTEQALTMLKKFQVILQRDSLKEDLDSKFMVIFHNYGLDLETVQRLYEKQKQSPPTVRNAPPVTASIMWARQLMRRIEEPMVKFQMNKNLMSTKESKKIVKTYNRIARTIVEFETLWHLAWSKSIESSKAGLQATLIIRHPSNGKLYVNFDREILQLIRETKCLLRMGVDAPESAKMVLLQENKFKSYYNKLSYALEQYEEVVDKIMPITATLLKPHLADMERKVQPGMVTLTWTSMNIDGYLHRIHSGLAKLDDLVTKIRDLIENRIERNLKAVAKMLLVSIPQDESVSLDAFVSKQERFIKEQAQLMASKNLEVEEGVADLLELINEYQLEPGIAPAPEEEQAKLREHYGRLLYRAVLTCTNQSLAAIKKRVGSRASGGFLFLERPFFDVDIALTIPHVSMTPTLDEIQSSINRCCRSILRVSKQLIVWSSPEDVAAGATVFDEIARDKQIVKMVLLLTGSVEGAKRQVYEYLETFMQYEWLWKENKGTAYDAFMKKKPTLEDFDAELKKYVDIEQRIQKIAPVHNIGALSLETAPLKASLKSEASQWKSQYSENLHGQASAELDTVVSWMDDMSKKLKREINDLDNVRAAMAYLAEVREKEGQIEQLFGPVEEMYSMLNRYEVRVTKEEQDTVGELPYAWKKLKGLADSVGDGLVAVQSTFKKELLKNVKNFVSDVMSFRNDWEAHGPTVPGITPMQGHERLQRFKRTYDDKKRRWEEYQAGEALFGLPVTDYQELTKTKKEIDMLEKVYSLYIDVTSTVTDYKDLLWTDVPEKIDEMLTKLGEFQNACKKMPKSLREYEAFIELKRTIDDFLDTLPLVQQLAHPSMRGRHWTQLQQSVGRTFNVYADTFKLSTLLEADLLSIQEDVEDITNSAVKELQIEEKLAIVQEDWADCQLNFQQFKSRGPIALQQGNTLELLEKLEESQMNLGSMLASRYVVPFKEDVTSWTTKLFFVSEILEQWVQVQSMWMYLEAVFTSGDIAKQMPQEAKRFVSIDKNWEKIMQKAFETRNVIQYCFGNDVLKNLLPHLLEQLEVCQKALSGYLDQKRAAFPRFYFVSDANLLEILSQGSNPEAIQAHLPSIFDSVEIIEFDRVDSTKVIAFKSGLGEGMQMHTHVTAVGNIEEWLGQLLASVQKTVNVTVQAAAMDCESMKIDEFTHKYQAQVSLIGIQFIWTLDCEDALYRSKTEKGVMNQTNKKNQQRLNDLIAIALLSDQDLAEHGKWTRRKVETMILVDVHARDVFDEMVKKKIKDIEDFEWSKQARFYWREDLDVAKIHVADVDFDYCNEYLGVKERLVITPLTDRCYITLSQALGMCLGGAPAGPAGTGKTETTKDMGCTLGKYVLVTNCGDQMDYRSTGKIIKGLAQAGMWGCFDEFNRIDLEVLSVVAQQVGVIFDAIKADKKTLQFTDGHVINLDKEVGYFITMNPGYAGRQELPQNLKSLFRGVMMMVPDRQIIMKVKLTGAGYKENAILGKKFNVLYKLCEEQLSKQAHYDFGLRNILAVLRTAGQSKRDDLNASEHLLLMRTLRDMNLSKFVAEDVPLFLSLIDDLFPGLKAPPMKHPVVEASLAKAIPALSLQALDTWVLKIIQTYEMSLVRHSLMLVGLSGTGKSEIIKTLHKTLETAQGSDSEPPAVGQLHKEVRMNPKAILAPQMFGFLDVVANEWTEGIFASLWRKANKDKKHFTWIVLDGPVDAIWIENMNTVMDDNRILTLANNDRIPMLRPNCTLHFEVEDLRNASPATVSRAGIIYVSLADLGWEPMVTSWIAAQTQLKAPESEKLKTLFDKFIPSLLEFLLMECSPMMYNTPVSLCTSCTVLMTALFGESTKEGHAALDLDVLERFFLYSVIWSVAGILENKDRAKVDKHLRGLTKAMPNLGDSAVDTIFEFKVDDATGDWVHWGSLIPTFKFDPAIGGVGDQFASLLIPTIDSVRNEYTMELSISQNRSVLFIGGPGTAKTSTVLQYLAKTDKSATMFKKLSFSSATTPSIFQRQIEGSVEKRQGKTFGPPGNKKMYVFIDDISMPAYNEWGDQITMEIVRQQMEYGGMYNLDKPGEFKFIKDLLFIGAMLQPGGGKNDISCMPGMNGGRCKRHFHIINVTLPSAASIHQIFGSLLKANFDPESEARVPEVWEISESLVEMTISIWEQVKKKMLPTPAKFHYIFNLRDLSRVFQGVFMCDVGEVLKSEILLLGLWKHECERVFADRLIDETDKGWFAKTIDKLLEDQVGVSKAAQLKQSMHFVTFLRDGEEDPETGDPGPEPHIYEPVAGLPECRARVQMYVDKFNIDYRLLQVDMVLFEDALLHFMRICRIMRTPRGSALLVGVGGSGKQTLTRLGAYVAGATFFQSTITKQYNALSLLEDFKGRYMEAGCKGRGVAFIFTDKEIKEESFLEYINIFLNTGELPSLFARDEMDVIYAESGEAYAKSPFAKVGEDPTKDELWTFFIDRVRANLHIVLCFSPVGPKLNARTQKFPALINGCTVDWYLPWPLAALTDVARHFMGKFDIQDENAEVVRKNLIDHMGNVHKMVDDSTQLFFERFRRRTYVTPKSYLGFIDLYREVYVKKVDHVQELASSINSGLLKLEQASADVDLMKIELREKEKTLAVAQAESGRMLQEITTSTARAEKKKAEVQSVKDMLAGEAEVIGEDKANVEADLLAAKPALDEAEAALSAITAKDIGMLKSLKKPPELIKRLFDCVLVLFQEPLVPAEAVMVKRLQLEVSWDQSNKVMSRASFLDDLYAFKKDNINDETIEILYPTTSAEDMTFADAKKASGNVAGLCIWVNSMVLYTAIAKEVKPKMAALKVAEGKLNTAMAKLAAAQKELDAVQAELSAMQVQFDEAMAKKAAIEADALATQKRMDSANKLIGALGGEYTRWKADSEAFADEIRRMAGDVALACAFVVYAGPFNADFRTLLINERFYKDCTEKKIPVTANLSVTEFMVDEGTISDWAKEGLPRDELSVQNGIMVTRSSKWPLLIDPQGQGLGWIKRRDEVNQLKVTQLTEKRFRNALEDTMSFGQPLLIENVEEVLDPILDPVLDKKIEKSGRGLKIVLADKEVEYSETFRMYMTTRLGNPHFEPELCAQVAVINFTVTMAGLEQQLLGRVVLQERAELEEQRQKLVEEVSSNQKTLKGLEDDLLYRLATSTGNLLDDTQLIEVLGVTKVTAGEVKEKLQNAAEANERISVAREEYRPVATRGSLLYFLVVDMAAIDTMYQVSLQQFLALFDYSIANSAPAPLASKRIVNIIEYLNYHTTCYMTRGLFERHKTIWTLMLAMRIQSIAGKLSGAQQKMLLTGGGALDINTEKPKPFPWIPDNAWLNVLQLSRSVPTFRDLPDALMRNDAMWKHWYDEDAPEAARIPDYEDRLTDYFDKLLLVRSLREDRALLCVSEYISETMGKRYVDSRPLDIKVLCEEADKFTPMIFILSMGSDPTNAINELARKKKKQVRSISMGQGQEPAARALVRQGMAQGSWVLLQNCHLGLKMMAELEGTLIHKRANEPEEVLDEFRLWISAEPHPKFPIGLLHMSIKVTNEAPAGVRAGVKGSYATLITQDMLDAVTGNSATTWRTMLYALAFMHTCVQERRKFGALGFCIPYEFAAADLSACMQFIQNHITDVDSKKRPVDWPTVNYMVCEVQYGGKITDDYDRRLFNTYGQAWLAMRVMEPGFEFYKGYKVPQGADIEVYRKYIETMSIVDNPELFGLHSNADLVYRTAQTTDVLGTILDISPKDSGGGGGESREDAVLRTVAELEGKLPPDYRGEETKAAIKGLGATKPLNICLAQEIDRLQAVISLVRKTLSNLKLAIAGTIVMSADLSAAVDALSLARVPPLWTKVSDLTMGSMGGWFGNICGRAEQLTAWLKGGRPNVFWLTGMFNPQGFLTANRQEVCRKHNKEGWALDDVVNLTRVVNMEREEVRKGPDEGVYIYGLFLDGCRWDKPGNKLADSVPKVLFAPLPVLLVTGQLQSERKLDAYSYSAPCYKNKTRRGLNFIFPVDLRSEEPPQKWILRGVCLLCAKD